MRVKTLVKLANIKEKPIDIYICYAVGPNYEKECEEKLEADTYHTFKDKKIIDWEYIPNDDYDVLKIIV